MARQAHPIPSATYRIQFHKHFTFQDARRIVHYLRALGISHLYASPFFDAPPESTHGYDLCNHNQLNPVLGSQEDFNALVEELHANGMGQILDFVPNHMGISESRNEWWMDVLENGPSSIYAPFFDIDWHPLKEELENKVLLPILGDQYGRVLERGELKVEFINGAFFLRYYQTLLPINPRSYHIILKPALEQIQGRYNEEECSLELQSILTAIEHLPARTESDPEKISERSREKLIIKRRLERLCSECPQIYEAILQSLQQINGRKGDLRSYDLLDTLLAAQCYRLSFWRVAAEEINYRRFFDINNLAAIRMELPEVFDAAHQLVLQLVENGAVNGLRIDHVDGLWDPRDYLEKLQQRCGEVLNAGQEKCPVYLLVEKILVGEERLHKDWPVHGTTGYDFTVQVINLLIDPDAAKPLTDIYEQFIGESARFADLVYQKKQLTMRLSLASEINVLGHILNRLSEKNRWYRDYTLNALTTAVREVIASFPVYRTYVRPGEEPGEDDRQVITRAVALAKRRNPAIERSVFDFLRDILLMKFPENINDEEKQEHLYFVMKFQQCTGPIMAKGLEDTAFYVYNRLIALNEVGGEPQHFGSTPARFHEQNQVRGEEFPHALLATSTHDTKRSEDVRARIAVISEIPAVWRRALQRWRTANQAFKKEVDGQLAPDANEEYLLYQTLLGTWPFHRMSQEEHAAYLQRVQDYMTKAIKEAKVNSSWIQPNEAWDEAVRDFVSGILGNQRFLKAFEPLAKQVAELGAINSLTQLVLKCTVPGVPDFYQGNEIWDFSMVDPDNRRPVDFTLRAEMLESLAEPAELMKEWQSGAIKLFATQRLLKTRAEHPELFSNGKYQPLETAGDFQESCFAFLRHAGDSQLLVIVPRLSARIGFPATGDLWRKTIVKCESAREFRDIFTGEMLRVESGSIKVADALRVLPFTVLIG
jgi:(1->4)-alpha-D-glucan 1-alpha-D-glucosylmutase